MKSNSTDPRALRTRESLREGLMQTVIQKPFREITVNDITNAAGVNRATFYLHYEDKYDLLEDCATNLVIEIRNDIQNTLDIDINHLPDSTGALHYDRMIIILTHFQKHRDFYLAIMGKNGDPLFHTVLRESASAWIKQAFTTVLEKQKRHVDSDLLDMMVRFQSAGHFDVIAWWLEQNMHTPMEVMAQRLAQITLPPMVHLIQGRDSSDC